MSETISKAADSVANIVRDLKAIGLPCVLWTILFAVALFKCDGPTLRWMWPYLWWTWIVLILLLLLGTLAVYGFQRAVARSSAAEHLSVAVAPESPPTPSNVEPGF